jgi:hypothetical protein
MQNTPQDDEYHDYNTSFITKSKNYLILLKKQMNRVEFSNSTPKLLVHSQIIQFLLCLESSHESQSLFEWVQEYFPSSTLIARDSINLNDDSNHWKIVFEFLLKGYTNEPFFYLDAYLRNNAAAFEDEDDPHSILHTVLHDYTDPIKMKDQLELVEWKKALKELEDAFEDDANLTSVIKILLGDENEISKRAKECGMKWFQIVIAVLNFGDTFHVEVKPSDLKNDFEKLLYFLWSSEDCNELFRGDAFDPWFNCHFTELLFLVNRIEKATRDVQFISWGRMIFDLSWRSGLDYITEMSEKQEFVNKMEVNTMVDWIKVSNYCKVHHLSSDVVLTKLTKNESFAGLLLSKKNGDKIVELCREYVLGKKDSWEEFDFLRRIKGWERDVKFCNVKKLFESPRMIWIVILKKIVVFLKTNRLDQNDVMFLMSKLEELKSHKSDEYFWYLFETMNRTGFSEKELMIKKEDILNQEIREIRLVLVNNLSRAIIY